MHYSSTFEVVPSVGFSRVFSQKIDLVLGDQKSYFQLITSLFDYHTYVPSSQSLDWYC